MSRHRRVAFALPALLAVAAVSVAGDPSPRSQDPEAIWALERGIYSGSTGRDNLHHYLDAMDAEYAGWPPQAAAPLDYAHIAEAAKASSGRTSVQLTMKQDLVRVHRNGNVALAFYTTHRSVRGGAAVDETFETLHVWIKGADGTWKLFGAMVRPVPTRAATEGVAQPTSAR